MAKKKLSFEEQIRNLEEIVETLDRGEAPLEELVDQYEEGMKLASSLTEFLDKAEQKITDISKKYGGE
jgi:exodeoxyribonuclease VII small subunit